MVWATDKLQVEGKVILIKIFKILFMQEKNEHVD